MTITSIPSAPGSLSTTIPESALSILQAGSHRDRDGRSPLPLQSTYHWSTSAATMPDAGSTVIALNNTAPVLDTTGNPTFIPSLAGVTNSSGTSITTLLQSLGGTGITDVNGGPQAIAVTGVNNSQGTWQYSTTGGQTWSNVSSSTAPNNAVVLGASPLYTGILSGTPDSQGWLSWINQDTTPGTTGIATQTASNGGTILDTLAGMPTDFGLYAGYSNYTSAGTLVNSAFPILDRQAGFSLSFNLQMLGQAGSDGVFSSGFRVVAISNDGLGIQIGFSNTDFIYAFGDGVTLNSSWSSPNQLLSPAEGTSFNLTAATNYTLTVQGNAYQLFANGNRLLTGALRNYSAYTGAIDPYETPNYIFLGDNSPNVAVRANLSQVVVQPDTRLRFVPSVAYDLTTSIDFRAWDTTNGLANGTTGVDTTNNGGFTAFSTAIETATLTVTAPTNSTPPTLTWAHHLSNVQTPPLYDVSLNTTADVAVDSNGNVYTVGSFRGTVDFDPGLGTFTLSTNGPSDHAFITKFDRNGNFIWAKSFGGNIGNTEIGNIAIAPNDDLYLTGTFGGNVDFDPGSGTANRISLGLQDGFMLKLNQNGDLIWVQSIGGLGSDFSIDHTIDDNGNLYTLGRFAGSVDFDPGAGTAILNSDGPEDTFITKFDSNGNFVWARQLQQEQYDQGYVIRTDRVGNVAIGGRFSGTTDFNPGPGTVNLTSYGSTDGFVLTLDGAGNFVSVQQFGGSSFDSIITLAFANDNSLYLGGYFSGTVDFDPGVGTVNLTSNGPNGFVVRLGSDRRFLWANSVSGSGGGYINQLAVDHNGSVYAAGVFAGTVDFAPTATSLILTSVGPLDIMFASWDRVGNILWAQSLASEDQFQDIGEQAGGIVVDRDRNLYIAGRFSGLTDFDPGRSTDTLFSRNSNYEYSGFVLKLASRNISAPIQTDIGTVMWRNQTTGQNTAWQMNSADYAGFQALPAVDPGWAIAAQADFDRDGDFDLVWRHQTTGQMTLWEMNGFAYSTFYSLPTISEVAWTIAGVADFDGDGDQDIVWRNGITGVNTIWQLQNLSFSQLHILPTVDQNWVIEAIANVSGSNVPNVFWRNLVTGQNTIWSIHNFTYSTFVALPTILGHSWRIVAAVDVDQDGDLDIFWRDQSTGINTVWQMNGTAYSRFDLLPTLDPNWRMAAITDFDGDADHDILWRNAVTGQNQIWRMNQFAYVTSIDLPSISTDWDIVESFNQ